MVLVSSGGFPDGTFNHEAISVKTEAECKATCLENYRTCKALSWLGSRLGNEPCVHYQTLRSSSVHPLKGCDYWKVVPPARALDEHAGEGEPQRRSLLIRYRRQIKQGD